ncbi:MAG: hypothetical protein U5L11_02615 [Arhodomonas sp.]|nr:hypothetical protein [Arhodomonas sp.]
MSLECTLDCTYNVEFSEHLVTSPGTEICRECKALIYPGVPHYGVRDYVYGEDDEIHLARYALCEPCGDLAVSFLDLGYCWTPGALRHDIAEMHE